MMRARPGERACDVDDDEPRCRVCGCTEDAACAGGCVWVPDPEVKGDLCSRCLFASVGRGPYEGLVEFLLGLEELRDLLVATTCWCAPCVEARKMLRIEKPAPARRRARG